MKKTALIILVLSIVLSVCYAEEEMIPLGIYNMKNELLIELGSPARDVVEKLGQPDNAYEPFVIYDKDKVSIPEIVEPVKGKYAEIIDMLKALRDAAPNEWDVLDTQAAAKALEPFGITVKEFVAVMDDITLTEADIERGRLTHSALESFVGIAESEVSLYDTQTKNYNQRKETPYEEWVEDVGSSLTITNHMLALMAQDGGRISFGLYYDGLSVTIMNDSAALREKEPSVPLAVYLQESLADTEYATIEERNQAIEEKAEEYRDIYRQWVDYVIDNSTVEAVRIQKPGYQTGRGVYVGKPAAEDEKWTVMDYYSGNLPLSREYVKGLSPEEKAGIDDLCYCSVRVGDKTFISEVSVGIAVKPKPATESAAESSENPDTDTAEETPIEDAFVDDLLHGFTERDRVYNATKDSESAYASRQVEIYTSLVAAEKEYLDKYRETEFSDETVKEAAWLYIDGLDRQYTGITEYAITDSGLYDQYWSDGYYERCRALYLLSEKYDLKVIITLQDVLNDMINTGAEVEVTISTEPTETEG